MERIGLLTFLALVALTSYAVHIARGEAAGAPFIGPQPQRRHGRSRPGATRRH